MIPNKNDVDDIKVIARRIIVFEKKSVKNNNAIKIMKPYRSYLINNSCRLSGKNENRILLPSKGGIGNKLKIASIKLNHAVRVII